MGSAVAAILASRLRSFLTILGVVIGVGAVVALVSLGQAATTSVERSVESLGTNLIVVTPGAFNGSSSVAAASAPITLPEEEMLAATVPAVSAMAPAATRPATLTLGNQSVTVPVEATTASAATIRNLKFVQGSFLSPIAVADMQPEVVLGALAAEDLLGSPLPRDAVGTQVDINGLPFTVTGIAAPIGQSGVSSQDETAYVPITIAQSELFGQTTLSAVFASARSPALMNVAMAEITAALSRIQELSPGAPPDFTVASQSQVLGALSAISATLTLFLGSVAAISLIVGGIGIMNIMLVSVTERTREIGVRKAVGARRRDILGQFLLEAVMLAGVGGVLGVIVGIALTRLGGRVLHVVAHTSVQAVVLALGFSLVVGIGFGIYPAVRAARLMPMQALRHE